MSLMVVWQVGESQRAKAIEPGRRLTIGRHPGCDVVLGDPHVSRLHATVYSDDDGIMLQNMSRTNPIVYNLQESLAENMTASLRPGDVFHIGNVQITAMAGEESKLSWKIRCAGCGHTVPLDSPNCPWCALPLSISKPLVRAMNS